MNRMERREFIKKTGPAVALSAVAGTTGFVFHNREPVTHRNLLAKTASFEAPSDSALPVLTSAVNPDPVAALNAALDGIGGIGRFVHQGERAVLKPNVGCG